MAATTLFAVSSVAALLVVSAFASSLQHSDANQPWIVVVDDTDNSINDDHVYLSSTARTYAKPYQSVYISTPKPFINRGGGKFVDTNAHQMPVVNVIHQKSGTTYIKSKDTITHEVTISSTEAPDCAPCSNSHEENVGNYFIETNSPQTENVKIYPHSHRVPSGDLYSTPRVELIRGDVALEIDEAIPENEDSVFSIQYPYQVTTSPMTNKIDQNMQTLNNKGKKTQELKDSFLELNTNLDIEREKLFGDNNFKKNDSKFADNKVSQPLSSIGETEYRVNYTNMVAQIPSQYDDAHIDLHPQIDSHLNASTDGFVLNYSSDKQISSTTSSSSPHHSVLVQNSEFDQFNFKKPSLDLEKPSGELNAQSYEVRYSNAGDSKNTFETDNALPEIHFNIIPEENKEENINTNAGYEIKYSSEAFSLPPRLTLSTLPTSQAETLYVSSTPKSEILMNMGNGEIFSAPFKQQLNKDFEINYLNKAIAGFKNDQPPLEGDIELIQYGSPEQQENQNNGLHEFGGQGFVVNYGSTKQTVKNVSTDNPARNSTVQYGIDNSLFQGKYITSTSVPMFEIEYFSPNAIQTSTARNQIEDLPAPPEIDLEQKGYLAAHADEHLQLKQDEGKVTVQYGSYISNPSSIPFKDIKIENTPSLQSQELPESPQELGFGASMQDGFEVRYSGQNNEYHQPNIPLTIQDSYSPFQNGYEIRFSGNPQNVEISTPENLGPLQGYEIKYSGKDINHELPKTFISENSMFGSVDLSPPLQGYAIKYTSDNQEILKKPDFLQPLSKYIAPTTTLDIQKVELPGHIRLNSPQEDGYEVKYSNDAIILGMPEIPILHDPDNIMTARPTILKDATPGDMGFNKPSHEGYEIEYSSADYDRKKPQALVHPQPGYINISPPTIIDTKRVDLPESIRLNSLQGGGFEVKYSDESKIGMPELSFLNQPDNIMTARPPILIDTTPGDMSFNIPSHEGYEIEYSSADYDRKTPQALVHPQPGYINISPPTILDTKRVDLHESIRLDSLQGGGYEVKYSDESKIRMPEMPILHQPDNIVTARPPILIDTTPGDMRFNIPSHDGYEIEYSNLDYNQNTLKIPVHRQPGNVNIIAPPTILDIQRNSLPGSNTLNRPQGGYEVKYPSDNRANKNTEMPVLHQSEDINIPEYNPLLEGGYEVSYSSNGEKIDIPQIPVLGHQTNIEIAYPSFLESSTPGSVEFISPFQGGYDIKYSSEVNNPKLSKIPAIYQPCDIISAPPSFPTNGLQGFEVSYSDGDHDEQKFQIPINFFGIMPSTPKPLLQLPEHQSQFKFDVEINRGIPEQAMPLPPTIDIDYVNGKPEILELQQLQEILSNKNLSAADLTNLNKSKVNVTPSSMQPVIEIHYGNDSPADNLIGVIPSFNAQELGNKREYENPYSPELNNPFAATFDFIKNQQLEGDYNGSTKNGFVVVYGDSGNTKFIGIPTLTNIDWFGTDGKFNQNKPESQMNVKDQGYEINYSAQNNYQKDFKESSPSLPVKGPDANRFSEDGYTVTYGNNINEDLQKYLVIPGPLDVDVVSIGGQYHQNQPNRQTSKSTQQPLSLDIGSSTPISTANGYSVEYGNKLSRNEQKNYFAIPSPPEVEAFSLGGLYHQNQPNNGYTVEYANRGSLSNDQNRTTLLTIKETEKISQDIFQDSPLTSDVSSAPTISVQEINGISQPPLPPVIQLTVSEKPEPPIATEFKQEVRPSILLPVLPTPPTIIEIDKSNVVVKPASEGIIEVQEPNIVLTRLPTPPVITEINKNKIVQPAVKVSNIKETPNAVIIPMGLPSRWRVLQPVRLQNIPLVSTKNQGHPDVDVKQILYRKFSNLFPSLADCLRHLKAKLLI